MEIALAPAVVDREPSSKKATRPLNRQRWDCVNCRKCEARPVMIWGSALSHDCFTRPGRTKDWIVEILLRLATLSSSVIGLALCMRTVFHVPSLTFYSFIVFLLLMISTVYHSLTKVLSITQGNKKNRNCSGATQNKLHSAHSLQIYLYRSKSS